MDASFCPSCGADVEPADNFCRKCGIAMCASVPAVRSTMTPTVWQPRVSPVMKGAAVMAAGTVGQFLLRRVVGNAMSAGARSGKRNPLKLRGKSNDGLVDEAQVITEMVMVRRVRLRRDD
jgi:hypothetical protein